MKINIDKHKQVTDWINNGYVKGLPAHKINNNGCWVSKNKPTNNGYVQICRKHNNDKHLLQLHTLSYCLTYGFDGMSEQSIICHREICNGFRGCFNPTHLYLGDATSNRNDRQNYGRNDMGENHSNAKLSEVEVREIIEQVKEGFSQMAIAKRFNVSQKLISDIKNGKKWKHIMRSV